MERLVLEYQLSDECTYSFTCTVPIVYESAEKFLVDFEELCQPDSDGDYNEFELCGEKFDPCDFYCNGKYYDPNVYTVDEWFATSICSSFPLTQALKDLMALEGLTER
jgi:hypothetical protein